MPWTTSEKSQVGSAVKQNGAQRAVIAGQMADFRQVLRISRERTPFYAKHLREFQADGPIEVEDLPRIRPVTKSDLLAAQLEHAPYGGLLATDPQSLVRIYSYPSKQVLAWTRDDLEGQLASYRWALETVGLVPDDIVDVTFQYGWLAAGTVWDEAARTLGCAVVPGGAGDSALHAAVIDRIQVSVVIGFPTFLAKIAEAATSAGLQLTPRLLVVAGERMTASSIAALSASFGGAAVREVYGAGEVGLVGATCEASETFHLSPRTLVEVRDVETQALVENGGGGEIYLTPLDLLDGPVIRLRTGDLTETWFADPCACGRSTPRMGRIVGRTGDLLRVKGLFLSQHQVDLALKEVGLEDRQRQVVVRRSTALDQVVLHVERPSLNENRSTELSDAIRRSCGMAMQVEWVEVGSIAAGARWFDDARHGRPGD